MSYYLKLFLDIVLNPQNEHHVTLMVSWGVSLFILTLFTAVFIFLLLREKSLKKDLIKFKTAVTDASEHIIITNKDGRIIFANRGVEKITGYSNKEVMGKNPSLWGGQMSPQFYQDFWKTIKQDKKPFKGEISNKRKNGEIYQAEVSVTPVLNFNHQVEFFVGVERDITKEKELQYSLSKLAAIIEGTDDAVIGKDLEGNILNWNLGAEKLYGYRADEIVGKNISILFPPDKLKEFDYILKTIKEGGRIDHYQTVRVRKNGSLVDISITISPIMDDAGKIIGSSAIAKDFTKEKEIDKAKSEFVSLAAHQLRSPLTTINWYSEILLGNELGQVSEKQKEYLEEINKSSRRMSELVNAFLSASRIDLGTFAINPQPMKLSEEINKSIDELEEKITKKKIIINKSIDENIPEINADPALVRIIMGNLISNSVKYSPEGSLVDVSATKDDKFINIKVSDHGCGIPQSQKDKIFGRLFRADNAAQIDPDGNGLGLYIVKSIIDKIKGKIRFESEEGKGTDFYVSLPLLGMPKIEGAKGLK